MIAFVHATQTYSIRPVGNEDELSLLALYEQCNDFLSLGPRLASLEMVQEDLRASAQSGGLFCGIYDLVGRLVAVVDFMCSGFEGNASTADVSLLMVAAGERSKGLGEAIFRAVEAEILRVGRAESLHAGVQVNNPRALAFWERQGFQVVGEPIDFPDGTTAVPLRKWIVKESRPNGNS